MATNPFAGGMLPATYPEAATLPAVRQLLGELIDMQFADLRVLLRLPDSNLAPHVGCNFTAAAMMTNLISGFSIWFFHNRYARTLEPKERKKGQSYSGARFKGFVRAYYPRQLHEPTATDDRQPPLRRAQRPFAQPRHRRRDLAYPPAQALAPPLDCPGQT